MRDNSLLNPYFVKKEIADSTHLLAQAETWNREFAIAYNEIHDALLAMEAVDPNRETYELDKRQVQQIVQTLARVKQNEFVFLSPRKVHVSQLTNLLNDRRYRIVAKLLKLFRIVK